MTEPTGTSDGPDDGADRGGTHRSEASPGPPGRGDEPRKPPAIAIVDAETPGNVGTVARSMKNFGFEELLLVDPPPLDPAGDAYGFAGHAREDVLPGATELTFEDLVSKYHTVATTAVTNEDDRSHVRFPFVKPASLPTRLARVEGPTALVFGRERIGLTNDELSRMDEICSIPANPAYPTLNLGQAATVVLYECRALALDRDHLPDVERVRACPAILERLYDQWDALLDRIDHPSEKRAKTNRMARRVFGRADLTEREANTFLGILRRAGNPPEE